MSISKKVIDGTFWVTVLRVIEKILGGLRQIILARLLFPEDFGLFGIASLMLLAFEVLTRTGFEDAIIHIQDRIEDYLHTSYWIQVLRGFVIGAIVYVGAPYIAAFFNEPTVIPIVRVLALVQVIKGMRSIGIVILRKELSFKKHVLYLFNGTLANFIVTVVLAVIFRDVWALVWGSVAAELVLTISSYFFHSFKPKLVFSWERARYLFNFGIWLLGSGILSYLSLQADNIFAGKFIGTSALGIYQMGYYIANLPTTEISKQIGTVIQSGYAELQNNKSTIRELYSKTFTAIFSIILPIVLVLILLTNLFVPILLGKNWLDLIPILPVLALGCMFRAMGTSAVSLFKATGLTKLVFYVEAVRSSSLIISLAFCFYLDGGILGVAWAYVISAVMMLLVYLFFIETHHKVLGYIFKNIWPSIAAGVLMALSIIVLLSLVEPLYLKLILSGFMGLVIYISTIYYLEQFTSDRILSSLFETLRKDKRPRQ